MSLLSSQLPQQRELTLPPSGGNGPSSISVTGSVVFVGGNGAGKTRLGTWIDTASPHSAAVTRIAAQKSLAIPESISPQSMESAENSLWYGYAGPNAGAQYKVGHKWGSKPSTFMQSDYDKLLILLFTEEAEKSTQYRQVSALNKVYVEPPITRLDRIKRIWEYVLPTRELLIRAGKIEVRARTGSGTVYHSAEMSDGERVIFYLIGQCLSAQSNAVLVLDEPELHLHRSLQARLWDAIEAERPDCLFVYLTHDLEFATSRLNAKKVWLESFVDHIWTWHVIPDEVGIPDRLLLEIIGSRKPIVFVEGDRGSLDHHIFSNILPNHTITPCGGAAHVIHATASFRALQSLHSLECFGIIDRDFRSDTEIANLESAGVYTLAVSEIENVLLSPEVLRVTSESLSRADSEADVDAVKGIVFSALNEERDRVASSLASARIEHLFSTFNAKAVGKGALEQSWDVLRSTVDVAREYDTAAAEIGQIISDKNYSGALRLFNNKGLIPRAANVFGMQSRAFEEYLRRLVGAAHNQRLIQQLQLSLNELSSLEPKWGQLAVSDCTDVPSATPGAPAA